MVSPFLTHSLSSEILSVNTFIEPDLGNNINEHFHSFVLSSIEKFI